MRATLGLVVAAVLWPSAAVAAPPPGSPEWVARDAENMLLSVGRFADQVTSPAYQVEMVRQTPGVFSEAMSDQLRHPDRPVVTINRIFPNSNVADPFRVGWHAGPDPRGVRIRVEWLDRYGVRIQGYLYGPKLSSGTLPGIVITDGSIGGYQEMYRWAAQGLAEAGYLVLTWDPQGQGSSETFPHQSPVFCEPDRLPTCDGVPSQQAGNFINGTYDALAWFRSDANPLRGLLDASRIGLAGHSLGASAATDVGNDPSAGVAAVVGWDNANLPTGRTPLVPTMGQNAEYFVNPVPQTAPPDPDGKNATFRRFREAGVPAMQVALRNSTHIEWSYINGPTSASSDGERVAMHYTLAWFDLYVKGDPSAAERLVATTFDGSADASAIGAGRYDPVLGNVPYRIEENAVAEHLSFYYRSSYAFGSHVCGDMLAGC